MTKEEILKDFRLFWGLAPEGTLKYERGKEVEVWLSSRYDQIEQETAKRFDTFKVTEYPNYSDFKDTSQAYIAGQMHIMIEIKQLIDKLTNR